MNKKEVVFVRATQEEKELWTKEAERLGISLSAYVRLTMNKEREERK